MKVLTVYAHNDPPDNDFNFGHFRMPHMLADLVRSERPAGIAPGQSTPDFSLQTTGDTAPA